MRHWRPVNFDDYERWRNESRRRVAEAAEKVERSGLRREEAETVRIADWTPGASAKAQGKRARLLAAWAEGMALGWDIAAWVEGKGADEVREVVDVLRAVHKVMRYALDGGLGPESSQEDVDRVFELGHPDETP